MLAEEGMETDEGVHHLGKRINAGQIDSFGVTTEGDEHLLLFMTDAPPQVSNVRVDAIKRPLEQSLGVDFPSIPVRGLDDARHFDKNIRPTVVQLAGLASRRQPTT
jgi:hypothetical protein